MASGNGNKANILDKNHGFMKFIIKNQIERNNYDKEQRKKKRDNQKPRNMNIVKNQNIHSKNYVTTGKKKQQYHHEEEYSKQRKSSHITLTKKTVELCDSDGDLDEFPSKLENLFLAKVLFNLEFLTKDGSVVMVPVKEDDTASSVVERVIEQYPLNDAKQGVLVDRVRKEIKTFRRNCAN